MSIGPNFFDRVGKATGQSLLKQRLKPLYLPLLHHLKFLVQNRDFKSNGPITLLLAHEILSNNGFKYWLDFGTLLGIFRDGELISHDTDLDIGMSYDTDRDLLKKAFYEGGFELVHSIRIGEPQSGLEQTFIKGSTKIDIFYYHQVDERMFCHLITSKKQGLRVRKVWIPKVFPLVKIKYRESELTIPHNAKERLESTYGIDWVTPIKNWYTPDKALNSELTTLKYSIINH